METTPKPCLQCGKPLRGRIDKKFCDDYCRTLHNNQLKNADQSLIKKVNAALKNNRRILELQIPVGEEMAKCPRKKLADSGFQFMYLTHQYANKKGNVYNFCYEYGYLPLEGDWLLIVKRAEK